MKKILQLVLNDFTNDSRVLRHSLSAVEAGYAVDIIALHTPGLATEEVIDGARIYRIPLKTRSLPKSPFFQAFKYFELLLRTLSRAGHYDIIHCNDLDPLPLAFLLKWLATRRSPSILYDSHELQTEQAAQKNKWLFILKSFVEKKFIKHSDQFITVSPFIAREYANRYSVKEPKVVFNCPNPYLPQQKDIFRKEFDILRKEKIFLYQGLLSENRGILQLIKAFEHPDMPENTCLVLMGHGPLAHSKSPKKISKNVFFHPAVSYDNLMPYTESADFGLLTIENNCLSFDFCLPNKLFEYAMAGLPVLATHMSQIAAHLADFPMGTLCDSTEIDDLIHGVKKILNQSYDEMKKSALECASVYNWQIQKNTLLTIYSEMAKS